MLLVAQELYEFTPQRSREENARFVQKDPERERTRAFAGPTMEHFSPRADFSLSRPGAAQRAHSQGLQHWNACGGMG